MKTIKAKSEHRLWFLCDDPIHPFRLSDVIAWAFDLDRLVPITTAGRVTGPYMLGTKTGWQHWPSGTMFRSSDEVARFMRRQVPA